MNKFLVFINIILAVLLIISYSLLYVSPFFNLKSSFISLIAILIGINFIDLIIPLSGLFGESEEISDSKLKVMSYNVALFGFYKPDESRQTKDSILNIIDYEQAHIVCLQEAYWGTSKNFITINAIMRNSEYKYSNKSPLTSSAKNKHKFGLVTLSKYPITNSFSYDFPNSNNGFSYSDIAINKDTVRVYNCHLQSIRLNQNDYEIISTVEKDKNMDNIDNNKAMFIFTKYLNSVSTRAQQAEMIKASIDSCKFPVIVCGDFNDFPISYSYLKLAENLNDSFVEKGGLNGGTWNKIAIPQRIDYILFSDKFTCNYHKIIKKDFSDHFPIIAGFDF